MTGGAVATLAVSATGDELLDLLGSGDDHGRRLIGISGAPGAGKSSLATYLSTRLGSRAAHVPMDGFHLADAELCRQGLLDRKGAPETFDAWGYAALLHRLRTRPDTWCTHPASTGISSSRSRERSRWHPGPRWS
ncbi:MAG TPA: hypothetical protein VFZ64_16265 [Nocardioidaceae bacterium]